MAGKKEQRFPEWFQERLQELRRSVPQVSVEETKERLRSSREPAPESSASAAAGLIVDIREGDEFRAGHIPGALHLPRGFLELRAEALIPDLDTPLTVYCAAGVRSLFAARTLIDMGYRDVRSLAGGFGLWRRQGGPFVVPEVLSDSERERYARHLVIDEVGEEGQLRLKRARVLCIGAGGLGSPAALYLAAAGVGTIGIVDDDVVDRSNLQRQVLHRDDRVGMAKTESARLALEGLNPEVKVVEHPERLTAASADALFERYDVVVDGCDNFATRYLVNDASLRHRIPNVHGSIYRFEGQVTVFWPGRGPCYRCLFPEPPPPELAPSCAEAGVLGVLPGVIGVLEATEAVKIVLGEGEPLVGRLLTYDALGARFREVKIRRDGGCRWCSGDGPPAGYDVVEDSCGSR